MPKAFARPSNETLQTALARAQRIAHGLFPHQVDGVAFLLARRKAILADDMGLGKTRQSIVALREAEPEGPYLVVCPASVKRNWAREIRLVVPDARVRIVGDARFDCDNAQWTIINYDILNKHAASLHNGGWKGIVFDEAHYLRNRNSQRSKAATKLAQTAERDSGPVVYALTGTPVTNRPRDLFPLLQLLVHPLGKSFLSYAKRYCAAYQSEYGWVSDGASNLEELSLELRGALLRRTKDDVLELPPKLRAWTEVEVESGLAAHEMAKIVAVLLQGRTRVRRGDRENLLALLTKARLKIAQAKIGSTIELVQNAVDQGEKVVVFSCFDDPVKKIQLHFGDAAVLLTGATPTARRQPIVDSFQNDDGIRVFVANIIAGGVGLNLTAASQVMFNDLDWVPANHWQAEDRAYRIGQTRTVNVTYVVAQATVDDFVCQVLSAKAALISAVVEGTDASGITSDVLSELEQILGQLSPQLPDKLTDDDVRALLEQAAASVRTPERTGESRSAGSALNSEALERAITALAEALRGPKAEVHRIESNSRPGTYYEITVDGSDVTCSCPGFEYRGQCNHAREFKKRHREKH